jgi:hypothetical protein
METKQIQIPESLPWEAFDTVHWDDDYKVVGGRTWNSEEKAYALHAANHYPALVGALEKVVNLTSGRPVDADRRDLINDIAFGALAQCKGGA